MTALLITSFASFGDLIYQTPLIRFLKTVHGAVDIWCRNHEPFLNNPNVREIYKLDSFFCPDPTDFYFNAVYRTTREPGFILEKMAQSNFHTVDFFTMAAANMCLRDSEKWLELRWRPSDEQFVRDLLSANGLITNEHPEQANFTVLCPAITWPSRTLPLPYYQELITKIHQRTGDKVVIVGKDIRYEDFDPSRERDKPEYQKMKISENKQLYPASSFPAEAVVDLTNKLTLHQLAALYSLTKVAINTENGNMVVAGTNLNCWNLYIPSLTAPEFRAPHRKGSMQYKTVIVGNDRDYYPASDYRLKTEKTSLQDLAVELPSVDKVLLGYSLACKGFKNGHSLVNNVL